MPTDKYASDLEDRTANSYETRDKGMNFPDVFKPELNIKTWYAEKGEHEIDILVYAAGANDTAKEEGAWTYQFDMHVHRNVGPRDLQFICMEFTYKKPCAICKYRNELRKNPPEGEGRAKDQHEEKLKQLKPIRQTLYNILVYDSTEQEDKGVQVWQVAHWFMENHLSVDAKIPKVHGGGHILFSHPSKEQGRSITFIRSGTDMNTKYEGHKFHVRSYSINKEDLEDCVALDEIVHIPSYDEVHDAFWDEAGGPEGEGEGEPRRRSRAGVDDVGDGGGEEPARPRRARHDEPNVEDVAGGADAVGEEDPQPRRRRPDPEPIYEGADKVEEEEPAQPRRSRREAPVEEGEEPRPRRTRNAEFTVEDGKGETDRPARRRKPVDNEPVEEESSQRRKLSKVGDSPKCPVPGGVFGKDTDDYDECETCDFWDACSVASK